MSSTSSIEKKNNYSKKQKLSNDAIIPYIVEDTSFDSRGQIEIYNATLQPIITNNKDRMDEAFNLIIELVNDNDKNKVIININKTKEEIHDDSMKTTKQIINTLKSAYDEINIRMNKYNDNIVNKIQEVKSQINKKLSICQKMTKLKDEIRKCEIELLELNQINVRQVADYSIKSSLLREYILIEKHR